MDLPDDLSGLSALDVLAFLRTATDDEVRTRIHAIGTETALGLLFEGMAGRFPPDAARRPGALAFVIRDGEARHTDVLHLTAEGAVHAPGPVPQPRATLSTDLVRFLRVAAGATDPRWLFLTRKLRLDGDVVWAVGILAGMDR